MQQISVYLTYAGALPFVICTVCILLGIHNLWLLGNTHQVLTTYALVIASFMSGSHWGQHLHISDHHISDHHWRLYLPMCSNANAVLLWIALLTLPFRALLITFIVSFLALLVIDNKLLRHGLISARYFRHRCVVTTLVNLTLLIAAING